MNRSGLSLVELLVAMVILTVGILGMAGGTGWMIRAVDLARLDTNRAAALQAAIEEVRGTPFGNIGAGGILQGEFAVSWTVTDQDQNSRALEFVTVGPGRSPGSVGLPAISLAVSDTLAYLMSRR